MLRKQRSGFCHYIAAKGRKGRAHWFDVHKGIGKALCGLTLPLRLIGPPSWAMPVQSLIGLCRHCVLARERMK